MKRKPTTHPVRTQATCPCCCKSLEGDTLPSSCPNCGRALKPDRLPSMFPPGAQLVTISTCPVGSRVDLGGGRCGEVVDNQASRVRVQLERPKVREFDVKNPVTGEAKHVVAASPVYHEVAAGCEVVLLQPPEAV